MWNVKFHFRVGKNISTKRPDGDPYEEDSSFFSFNENKNEQRLDVTNQYKYPEGNYLLLISKYSFVLAIIVEEYAYCRYKQCS